MNTNKPVGSVDMKRIAGNLNPRAQRRCATKLETDVTDSVEEAIEPYERNNGNSYNLPGPAKQWLDANTVVYDTDEPDLDSLLELAGGTFVEYTVELPLFGSYADAVFFKRPSSEFIALLGAPGRA